MKDLIIFLVTNSGHIVFGPRFRPGKGEPRPYGANTKRPGVDNFRRV